MRYLILVLSALLMCVTNDGYTQNKNKKETTKLTRAQKKAEKERLLKGAVMECINKDSLILVVTSINPLGGTSMRSTEGYTIRLVNNKVTCKLPYHGKTNTPMFGAQDVSLRATDQQVSQLQKEYSKDDECTYYLFYFMNESTNERCECIFQIYNNAVSNIKISHSGRDAVGFKGELKVEY